MSTAEPAGRTITYAEALHEAVRQEIAQAATVDEVTGVVIRPSGEIAVRGRRAAGQSRSVFVDQYSPVAKPLRSLVDLQDYACRRPCTAVCTVDGIHWDTRYLSDFRVM